MQASSFPLFTPPLLFLLLCTQGAAGKDSLPDVNRLRIAIDTPDACKPEHDSLHCELARRFARKHGSETSFLPTQNIRAALVLLETGQADLIAPVPRLPALEEQLRLTPAYQRITWLVVYRQGRKRPRRLDEFASGEIVVPRGSSQELLLESLRNEHPALSWTSQPQSDSLQLLEQLQAQHIGATLVDSSTFAVQRRHLPDLLAAFTIGKKTSIGWGFKKDGDKALLDAATHFLEQARKDGTLEQLTDRYLGHVRRLNYIDRRALKQHIEKRLPAFRDRFKQAANETASDWRLLAAIGYQESHWDPKAVSPTGVRGLMMLSRATAEHVGISDRTDPTQSIKGAARYLQELRHKLPARIPEPDRTWLTLAAYNLGFAHLEDARILTQRRGGNPDRWMEVRAHLPLLEEPDVAATLKRGLARGNEAVNYVENIRNYVEILKTVFHEHKTQAIATRENPASDARD